MYTVYYRSLATGHTVRVPGTFKRKTAELVMSMLAERFMNRLYWIEPVA